MEYDLVHPFQLSTDNYLFFDIFHKNNELILICPVYTTDVSFINQISITHGSEQLKMKREIKKICTLSTESTIILIYDCITDNLVNTFNVKYMDMDISYTLSHRLTTKSMILSLTTIFKDDYKLINIFYDYYTKEGVEYFYMYYNGKINDEIRNYYNKSNIKLIEWNYSWKVNSPKELPINQPQLMHHAQPGQMHHAIYKYGKNESEYMCFCDLDEYMYINLAKYNYITLRTALLNMEYDTIAFKNYWSVTLDNNIPESFPMRFKSSSSPLEYPQQGKNIHRLDSIDYVGIHYADNYNNMKITFIGKLYHFYNWCQRNRIKDDINTIVEIQR